MAFLHSSQLIFYDCGYPRWSVYFTMPNAIFFYFLFADFYKKSYKSLMNSKAIPKKENGVTNSISNGTANSPSDNHKHDNKNKDKQS